MCDSVNIQVAYTLHFVQNVSISFINNTAKVGGAALYGSDLRRCSWLNVSVDDSMDHTIFTPPKDLSVPFIFQ